MTENYTEHDDVELRSDGGKPVLSEGLQEPITTICSICSKPIPTDKAVTRRGEPTHRDCTYKRRDA